MRNINQIIEILNDKNIKILGIAEAGGRLAIVVPKYQTEERLDFSGLDPEYKREFIKDWMPSGAPFIIRNYLVGGVFIASNGIIINGDYKSNIEEVEENWHGQGDVSDLSYRCREIHDKYEKMVMEKREEKKEEDQRRRQRRFKNTTLESRLNQVLSIENLEISESEIKTLTYFLQDHLVEDIMIEVGGYKKLNATECIYDVFPIVKKASKTVVF